MEIQLTADHQQRLARHAQAAGYSDLQQFVVDQLVTIATQPTLDKLPAVDEATAKDLIQRGEQDLAAGKTHDMEQALLELGRQRGYTLDE